MDELCEDCEYYAPVNKPKITSKQTKRKAMKRSKQGKLEKTTQDEIEKADKIVDWERRHLFTEQWQKIKALMGEVTCRFFQTCVDKLHVFVDKYAQVESMAALIPTAMISLNSRMIQERVTSALVQQISSTGSTSKHVHLHNTNTMKHVFKTFKQTLCPQDCDDKPITLDDLLCHTPLSQLVIFIYDFENFDKKILINIILIMKEYIHRFPIVLVIMVQSEMNNSVEYFLPARVTDYLMIEDLEPYYEPKFIPSLFTTFICNREISFKLHPHLIKQVYLYFNNFELSYGNFLSFMEAIMFQYYYTNPLSIITSGRRDIDHDEKVVNIMRNSLNVADGGQLSDAQLVEKVYADYDRLMVKHASIITCITMLMDLGHYCYIANKSFLYFYLRLMSDGPTDLKDKYLSLLYKVAPNVWKSALTKMIAKHSSPNPLLDCLQRFQAQLEEILAKDQDEEEKQKSSAMKMGLDCGKENDIQLMQTKLRNIASRTQWRMSVDPKNVKKNFTRFEVWKLEIINEMDEIVRREWIGSSQYLVDGLMFNDTHFVNTQCFVAFREKLDLALVNTHNSACEIVYKLYKSSPSESNLYDWYEHFCKQAKLDKSRKRTENELLVEFLSTISDFEFIGLLFASKFKADHFTKLVWF